MPEHEARRRAVYDHDDERRRSAAGRASRGRPSPGGRLGRGRGAVRRHARPPLRAPWGRARARARRIDSARRRRRRPPHDRDRPSDDVRLEDEAPAEEFAQPRGRARGSPPARRALGGRRAVRRASRPRDPYASAIEAFAPGGRFAEEAPARRPVASRTASSAAASRPAHREDRRPAARSSIPSPARRSRTIHERLGPRPDRIAAWAFALGLLLILIAIATANI